MFQGLGVWVGYHGVRSSPLPVPPGSNAKAPGAGSLGVFPSCLARTRPALQGSSGNNGLGFGFRQEDAKTYAA